MKMLKKETVLREPIILISAVSFFILPYLLHLGINGIQPGPSRTFFGSDQTIKVRVGNTMESMQLDAYLLGALARIGNSGYCDETLKALTVVLRSNAFYAIMNEQAMERENFYSDEELRILWGSEYEKNVQRYRDVIASTEGIVIFYQGEIIRVPFHTISAGATRGGAALGEDFPYVHSVESSEDMYAEEYYTTIEIPLGTFGDSFDIEARDEWGYVLSVCVGDEVINGETFRKSYGLPSACFDYEKTEENYIFRVRGIGHGFGLSIYGAEYLGQKGYRFGEILEYYFFDIEIRKENRNDV